MNLLEHLTRQMAFSKATFGPGAREKGVIDHIRKELIEIGGEPEPDTLELAILHYFDGSGTFTAVDDELQRRRNARQTPPQSPDRDYKAKEWVDVVLLGLDGLWRSLSDSGWSWDSIPKRAVFLLVSKQTRNEIRDWPDWRTADPDKAIEHDRSGE